MSILPKAINDLGDTVQRAVTELGQTVQALQQAARADDKTPLLNGSALSADGTRIGSQDGPDVVVFGDLSNFKNINDTHGHAAGDAAISQVGNMVQTLLVEGCRAYGYRQSGDEFVGLLHSDVLENFRRSATAFGHCSFHIDGKPLAVAMSFGFAVSDGKTAWFELIRRAEVACLVAKSEGDGRSVQWTPEVQQTAAVSRRFRCSCGVKFRCEIPVGITPTRYVCPVCGVEQPGTTRPADAAEHIAAPSIHPGTAPAEAAPGSAA